MEYVVIHLGTDIVRNIKTEYCSVSISGIVPQNDNLNNKALEVNQELLKIYKEAKFGYIDHKNINTRTHMNKSRLHLIRNGPIIMENNFLKLCSKTLCLS